MPISPEKLPLPMMTGIVAANVPQIIPHDATLRWMHAEQPCKAALASFCLHTGFVHLMFVFWQAFHSAAMDPILKIYGAFWVLSGVEPCGVGFHVASPFGAGLLFRSPAHK